MLKKLEIIDFEAHQNTVIHFGPGFNVIHGNSNKGKSASLRAIELAGYGAWAAGENKKEGVHGPVRVGAKFAEVILESDKGTVKVKRGKSINEWEISNTEIGEDFSLQNPGAGAIPQAQDVLGLRSTEIAGIQIRFNWSDQRDKHFLIDEVEGKSSSPSFVAGVLDEVGGLSGCEDLVRGLASDKSTHEKAMRDAADQNSKIKEELEKFNDLNNKISQMKKTEKALNEAEALQKKSKLCKTLAENIKSLKSRLSEYEKLEFEIKETDNNSQDLKIISEKLQKFQKIIEILTSYQRTNKQKSKVQEEIEKLEFIDIIITTEKREKSEKFQKEAQEIRNLLSKIRKFQNQLNIEEKTFDFRKISKIVAQAETIINSLSTAKSLNNSISVKSTVVLNEEKELQKVCSTHNNCRLEYDKIIDEMDICIMCGQEITAECKVEMKEGV